MKLIKYITISLVLGFIVMSCDKHEILYDTTDTDSTTAEFQLHYFAPIANTSENYNIDSVFVNGILYSSVDGSGQLVSYNGVPGGTVGRFFSVKAGTVNFKFYIGENVAYSYDAVLSPGKQNVFVHDLTKAPIVIDNGYPYRDIYDVKNNTTVEAWNTDSIATVRFYNFLYEDATTPYPGKIQYQYQDVRTENWVNVGGPVAFGEASERTEVLVVKSVFNSQGSCRVNYRMLDENGSILRVRNNAGVMVNYADYWTLTIGRAYMHIYGGVRTAAPNAAVRVWTSL